jgi:hypothetical protein
MWDRASEACLLLYFHRLELPSLRAVAFSGLHGLWFFHSISLGSPSFCVWLMHAARSGGRHWGASLRDLPLSSLSQQAQ